MKAIEAVFSWLLCCHMPLSTEAFAKAISYTLDECPELKLMAILDMCSNLVVIDETFDVFRFAHLSVQEYLQSKEPYNNTAFCHSRILLGCLNHLATHDFRISPYRRIKDKVEMNWQYRGTNVLLKRPGSYMCLFWPTHLDWSREYRYKNPFLDRLFTFFRQSFAEWVETARIIMLSAQSEISTYEPKLGLLLSISEYYRYMNLSQPRASHPNPLSPIIVLGCAEVLERWPDVDLSGLCNGIKPLLWACQHGHHTIIKQLLLLGANPNEQSPNSLKQVPPMQAVMRQNVARTKVIVSYGTMRTIEPKDGLKSLFIWVARSNEPILERYWTDYATGDNLSNILRSSRLDDAQTACETELFKSSFGVLELPKDAGTTPMYDTLANDDLFASGLLAEHGARLCAKTPIGVALRRQDLGMLALLLSHGAKVNEHIMNDWYHSRPSKPPSLDDYHSINQVFSKHGIYYQLPEHPQNQESAPYERSQQIHL